MSDLEFGILLDESLPFNKRGSTFAERASRLHATHSAMHKYHQGVHDSLDDGHEHKLMHRAMADHHKECADVYKSLSVDLGGESSGDFHHGTGDLHGPKLRRSRGDDIVDDGVVAISGIPSHLRLVPRGSSGASLEKAQVPPELESMFEL